MTLRTISCVDCGHQVQTARANTLRCSVCRLVRDLPYVTGRLRLCALCDNKYAPLDVHDPLCGTCTPDFPKHGITECAFCHQEKPRARAEIAVCKRCARDPDLRKKFYNSLQRKQQQRIEAHA